MSDALSELNAFLKSVSKQHQQHQLEQSQLSLQHPPGLAPLPGPPPNAKSLTEQELLIMYSANQQQHYNNSNLNQTSSLLSQIPLPNPVDIDLDFANSSNKTSLLDDEFQTLTFNTYKSSTNSNYNSNYSNNKKYSNYNNTNNKNFQNTSLNDSLNTNSDPNSSVIYSSNKYYMPGTASLIEDVDKQLMVILRDGKTLIGYLRSIDQYANLLLSNTIERVHVGNKYGDIPRGVYIIRGENVVLIGEVDFGKPCKIDMVKVDVEEILELKRSEEIKEQESEKNKKKALMNRCLLPQTDSILDDYY